MGYTHYFTLKNKNIDLNALRDEVQTVLDEHKDIIRFEFDSDEPALNSLRVNDNYVLRFNGIGNDGHETFYFDTSHTEFNFCKTARKPYDLVVCKVLLILKKHFQDKIEISSDGLKGGINNDLSFIDDGGEYWNEAKPNQVNSFAKEISLLCCVIRENEIIQETMFQSFDKIYEIAQAFIDKYGIDNVWGIDVGMEYETTVVEFAKSYILK